MIQFLKKYYKEALFGLGLNFFSGPGQTFLISLFNPHIISELSLSSTELSIYYSIATLISAFTLPYWGNLLDRSNPRKFFPLTAILFSIGLIILSLSYHPLLLLPGFFLIRNLGQGSFTLTSSTILAKKFNLYRGKALSIASLGFPLSEAVFPILVSFLISNYDWRITFFILALIILLFYLPGNYYLIKSSNLLNQSLEISSNNQEIKTEFNLPILKTFKFWALNFTSLIPAAVLTGLFFHQASFATWKNWSLELIAKAFIVYAIFRGVSSFIIGPLIDRFSARKLYPFFLIPLIFGVIWLIIGKSNLDAYFYLSGLGICIGISGPLKPAAFAEIYGIDQLGKIKGIQSSTTVISTALMPIIYGFAIDLKVSFLTILMITISVMVFASIMNFIICFKKQP
jgi:MFS family permease